MASCMSCAVGVPGVCCRMICPTGVRSTCISVSGNGLASGNRSTPHCDGKFASALGAIPNRVRPFSTVNRSKPVRFGAMHEAMTAEKKVQGRKRHLLVDTQGLLISVKVLGADIGDREGGKELLHPLVGKLPRLQLIWADSGYAGDPFKQWVKAHVHVRLDIVNHPWTGIRALWVKEEKKVDWAAFIPKAFHTLPKRWVIDAPNAGTPTTVGSLAILRARTPVARRSS